MSAKPTFDLTSEAFRSNPFPTYARMRQEAPVYPHQLPPGQTVYNAGVAWYITRYDDAKAVLRDHARFSRDFRRAVTPEMLSQMAPLPPIMRLFTENMVNVDEPEHLRLRALVNKAFSPRIVLNLQERIESIVDALINNVQDRGEMDLIEQFSFPVPITVITELLGLPASDINLLREISTIAPPASPSEFEATAGKIIAAKEYFSKAFADRLKNPKSDLTTALVEAEIDGQRLEGETLLAMVMLLLVAGYTTTVHLIGNGVLSLLRHPDQLDRLKRNPEMIESAVDELIRYDGPMETALMRWATEDVNMRDQTIRRGELVMVVLTAANRDPEQFMDPDRLDLGREKTSHLGFGHGIHFCLGAHLARLEGQVAIAALLRRLRNLRLKGSFKDLKWRHMPPTRGLEALPVAWDRD